MGPFLDSGQWDSGDSQRRFNSAAAFPLTDGVGPISKTAAYTITAADLSNGLAFDNAGASGSVTFTLPAPKKGLRLKFYKAAAQTIVVTAASGTTINGAASFTSAGDTDAAYLELTAISATKWRATGREGTWS